MKAILEFDLPEESHEHRDAINGNLYRSVISSTLDFIRQKLKYESHNLTDKEQSVLEELRGEILDSLNEDII